jgi:hypothetical protein
MRIAVVMIIESEDYGEREFKKEVENLIHDIDENSKLIDFKMYQTNQKATCQTLTK